MTTENEIQLIGLVVNCGLFFQREINKAFLPFGLNYQQFCVFNEIIRNGPLSQREVCERLLFEKSNTSKIIKILLGKNLIQMTSDIIDRRLTLLSETPEGFSLWKDLIKVFHEFTSRFSSVYEKEDIALTTRNLKKLQKTALKKSFLKKG